MSLPWPLGGLSVQWELLSSQKEGGGGTWQSLRARRIRILRCGRSSGWVATRDTASNIIQYPRSTRVSLFDIHNSSSTCIIWVLEFINQFSCTLPPTLPTSWSRPWRLLEVLVLAWSASSCLPGIRSECFTIMIECASLWLYHLRTRIWNESVMVDITPWSHFLSVYIDQGLVEICSCECNLLHTCSPYILLYTLSLHPRWPESTRC